MATQHDTLIRYITMLQLIPRAPQFKATTTLRDLLADRGFHVDLRSIQRDLDKMSLHFPLLCNKNERPYRWSFDPSYKSNLPALDTATALTLVLAEEYLKSLLPQIAIDRLSPQFDGARKFLDGLHENGYASWSRQVRAIPNGKALLPAAILPHIWQGVSDALLERQTIAVQYLSRQQGEVRAFTLHPQGLVVRHSVSYLLATVNDYEDIRQFALHRIQELKPSPAAYRSHPDFSVEAYIAKGAFGYPLGQQHVELVAKIDKAMAWLLAETPISQQQHLSAADEQGWITLTATVPNDQQTQWWIMGFGARIQVLAPSSWREAIIEQAQKMMEQYGAAPSVLHQAPS
ncbi:WYL domain-containing protein [Oceanisphaera profunda]|uniref:WYL domain-containing protein n=1 Tax=Oceanisphaera profunda TaxID=1416627 RepID=A0A1Y0D4E6_9GAMM|nr:WYL domain-containing protein [Oceanisphaera profunda]ART81985.1 WYL domain-containing protein [Oceanisphaera profunda]